MHIAIAPAKYWVGVKLDLLNRQIPETKTYWALMWTVVAVIVFTIGLAVRVFVEGLLFARGLV